MIEEIDFHEHRDAIAKLRREVYTSGLIHDIDEFDEAAHHFALFNSAREITGVIRVLRSDEVPKLELQSESDAQELVFPQDGLIIEVSRGCARKSLTGMPMMQLAMAMQQYAKEQKAAHVVTKSGKRLLPLYKSMGFRVFGKPFYSDWFDDRKTGLMSIPIIYEFVKSTHAVPVVPQPEEEVLVW
jgi:predicted GNAT family N-acyltransferase